MGRLKTFSWAAVAAREEKNMEKDIDIDIPESPVYCGGCAKRLYKKQIRELFKRGLIIGDNVVCSGGCKILLQRKVDEIRKCI